MSDWAWLRRLSDDAGESVLTEADVRRIVREEISAQLESSVGSAASPSLDTADRTHHNEGEM